MHNASADYGEITHYMFYLSLLDTKRLRGKYRISNEDLPHGVVMSAKREHIIEHLAQEKFGVDAMHNYHNQCIEWDITEKLMSKTGKRKKA